ncbi:MAG: 4'-phosphopantetheinyl transferase superfamily protein [Clostridia bacterium]|nr:4'-phosphopantetheinyl transferase superfamily protein [Clostridia bacterium]
MVYYTYTDYLFLKLSGNTYKAYINFCKGGNDFSNKDPNSFLHHEEDKYLETLTYERRINSYLLGRYSVKKAVSALIGEDNLKKILIKNGVFNQPIVVCESYNNLQTSLTHCDDFAAAVAFDGMFIIGIDIEKINRRTYSGLESELTPYEKELAYRISYSYESFVVTIWTMKEALSKALKTGLTVPLSVLEVKSIEVNNGYLISTYTNFYQYKALSFVIEGYVCSIAYPKNVEIDIDINRIKGSLYKIIKPSL